MFTPNKSQGILREDIAHDERVDRQPMRHHHIVSYDFVSKYKHCSISFG